MHGAFSRKSGFESETQKFIEKGRAVSVKSGEKSNKKVTDNLCFRISFRNSFIETMFLASHLRYKRTLRSIPLSCFNNRRCVNLTRLSVVFMFMFTDRTGEGAKRERKEGEREKGSGRGEGRRKEKKNNRVCAKKLGMSGCRCSEERE